MQHASFSIHAFVLDLFNDLLSTSVNIVPNNKRLVNNAFESECLEADLLCKERYFKVWLHEVTSTAVSTSQVSVKSKKGKVPKVPIGALQHRSPMLIVLSPRRCSFIHLYRRCTPNGMQRLS
jgi:hypothetical protein